MLDEPVAHSAGPDNTRRAAAPAAARPGVAHSRISPRWRKVLRDLVGHKARSLLVVLSIAVGVFAIGTISSTQLLLARDLASAYAATNPPGGLLTIGDFDEDLLTTIRGMPEVRDADAHRSVPMRIRANDGAWRNVEVVALRDFDDIRVNRIMPDAGEWPPRERELLLERASLLILDVKPGDTVTVETPEGDLRQLRVAGLAYRLLQPPVAFTRTAAAFVTPDTIEWLGQPRSFNVLSFTVAEQPDNQAHIQDVMRAVQSRIENGGRPVLNSFVPTPGKHPADEAIQPVLLVLAVLGYLALAMSGLLVVNTVSGLIAQQTRQIGVMKAIGGRTGQIVAMYLGLVALFGLLALALAVPLGALGAQAFSSYIAGLVNFDIVSFPLPPEVLALQIAVGLGVPLLAALYPVVAGVRVTIREAIASHGIGEQKPGRRPDLNPKSKIQNPKLLSLSRPVLLSLRNTFRRRGRLALTLVTLTLGGGIFIAVVSVRASLLRTYEAAAAYRAYDVEVQFARDYRAEAVQRVALQQPGVSAVEAVSVVSARRIRPDDTESDNLAAFGMRAETNLVRPTVQNGRWLLPGDENALVVNTDLLKDEPDVAVGHSLRLKIDGRESDWTVVGVVRGVLAGPYVYINEPYFSTVTRQAGRANRLQIVASAHDPQAQTRLAEALEQRFKDSGYTVALIRTTADQLAGLRYQFDILVVFLFIMALLISTVGGIGLAGTMGMNVLERTREIGVMRAIGASDVAVRRVFLTEGVVIGLLSWAAGVLLALPLSIGLSNAIGDQFLRSPLDYTFPLSGPLAWLVGATLLALVASYLPARSASRLSVRDVLAYE